MSQTTELPQGWTRRRLRFDAEMNPLKSKLDLPDDTEVSFVPMDAVGEYGGLRLDETRELDDVYTGYTYMADGDVSVAKITPCFENGKGALAQGLTNGVAFGTTELHVIRPSERIDGRFLCYLTMAHDFRSFGEAEMIGAGGQKRVPTDFLKDWRPPMPPLDVQRRIAQFLDDKTERIDALVEKKRALLDRLAEKRQSLITAAVTKGLNPGARMKPSGVEWLGDVPEHWEIKPLRRMIDLRRGHDLPHQNREEGDIPIISSAGPSGTHSEAATDGPTIVTGRYGTIGTFYLSDGPCWPLNTTLYSKYIDCNINYAIWLLRSVSHLFVLNSLKSAVPGVDRNDLASEPMPRPPEDEQKAIADYIESRAGSIEGHSERVIESIDLLTEYRAALVTAAVTGQIKDLR